MIDWRSHLARLLRPTPAWLCLVAALSLFAIGTLAIGIAEPEVLHKQAQWLVIGLIAMFAATLVHPKHICASSTIVMVVTLALLTLLILPGVPGWLVPERNGARCWINLHVVNFQPSELAKIACVLSLAAYLRYRGNYRTLTGLAVPLGIVAVPVLLIVKEPDLGSAVLFPPVVLAVLVAAGAKLRHMLSMVGIVLLAVVLVVVSIYTLPDSMQKYVLQEHQRRRIKSMISLVTGDTSELQSANFQQDRAMVLIGAGGLTGYGPERTKTIVELNQLPHDHNDMIFAVICARWGFIGGMSVLLGYGVLIGGMFLVAMRLRDPFARLVTVGLAAFMFTQATVNIGQTIGLLPVTGITLPFVSYGGSSLAISMAMVGLVMNFASRPVPPMTRPSFEYSHEQ